MKKNIRISDLITTSRVVAVVVFASLLIYQLQLFSFLGGLVVLIAIFLSDSLDGYFARKYDEHSEFGSFYDITGDRIAETVLLIPFTVLGIANPLVLIYFVSKGFLIDFHRYKKYSLSKDVPFKQIQGKLRTFLVSSRVMRFGYGIAKLLMFIAMMASLFEVFQANVLVAILSTVAVTISLLRTLPSYI